MMRGAVREAEDRVGWRDLVAKTSVVPSGQLDYGICNVIINGTQAVTFPQILFRHSISDVSVIFFLFRNPSPLLNLQEIASKSSSDHT